MIPFKTFIWLLFYAFLFSSDPHLTKSNPNPIPSSTDHSDSQSITTPFITSSRIHNFKTLITNLQSMSSLNPYGDSKPILNRSLTITSSTVKKPYLYQPFDRSNTLRKFYNNPNDNATEAKGNVKVQGTVKQLCNMFESRRNNKVQEKFLTGTEDRIVVYFTSLRGVRRTYEDCYAVRMIFRGFRVYVDERDVSMDVGYRRELLKVLNLKTVNFPQVFIKGTYIGGVDAVKQLHEDGQLLKMVQGLPIKAAGYVCHGCGDVRFMPCLSCSGSKKIYDEDEVMLKRCRVCNENGLIRCPKCCL